jgi:DegV family protein with EDD domain
VSEIAIITDSTSNIPVEFREQYGIQVIPQVLIWGEETLFDEVEISADQFYERLRSSGQLPKTSQATIANFIEFYEPHVQAGRPILAILISNELSGTIHSATQAKKEFPGATIEIVDSRSASMELGFQVLAAARAAEVGKSFNEVVEIAKKAKDHTGVMFVVDTLEYLHRGGRIGGASRLLGTALNIKPLLYVNSGRVEPLENVRTKGKALIRLLNLIEERISAGEPPIRIAALHAACPEDGQQLLEKALQRFQPAEGILTVVGPVVGTHVGPGTLGIAYCTGL